MSEIRVRFAPSPTGYLHVGGARTALFNFLYARAVGGKFLLRIEDTDPVRSRGELAEIILDGLRWLGIESDEPVVYQSDHTERFRAIALELIERGAAYRDYTTPEELESLRRAAQERREPSFRFRREMIAAREEARREDQGKTFAVRFSAPREGVGWDDLVHGPIHFDGAELEDFVLLRSDGTPTYHLSVVCDDHDMTITHVLRGDDHVSNTPKQISLYRAMQWDVPRFGHVPLILGPDKQRLSKRTGATAVGEFQERGFLPRAMFNFLALLGWSPGSGDREIFLPGDLIQCFSIAGIQAKSAVFDFAKLEWMNGEHLRLLSDEMAADYLLAHRNGLEVSREQVLRAWPLMRQRVRMPQDIFTDNGYLFSDPTEYDAAGQKKHASDPHIVQHVKDYRAELAGGGAFEAATLEAQLRAFCETRQISAGKLIHPIRLALTGKTVSPGLFELMVALERDTVLRRLDQWLKAVA